MFQAILLFESSLLLYPIGAGRLFMILHRPCETRPYNENGEPARRAAARFGGRKVRSPQGSVPANGRGPDEGHGKCHRKYTAGRKPGKGEKVR